MALAQKTNCQHGLTRVMQRTEKLREIIVLNLTNVFNLFFLFKLSLTTVKGLQE